jgi:catechol 2,3-dioxygenase-like lactoylglutathione lyase family enzyme
MALSIGPAGLWVNDLDASERFYVDGLGLEVVARIETADVREVIVASSTAGFQLMLARRISPRVIEVVGGIWKIFMFSDDAEADFERALAAGGTPVAHPAVHQNVGFKIALIEDLDGYLLEFGQRLATT